jgi:hypothetical protein
VTKVFRVEHPDRTVSRYGMREIIKFLFTLRVGDRVVVGREQ